MRARIKCIDIIQKFNKDKPIHVVNATDAIRFLNDHGLPIDYKFFKILLDTTNVIEKVRWGRYKFNVNPTHYMTLQKAYDDYHIQLDKASNSNLNKEIKIGEAIRLLKENGFMVYKPMQII